MLKSKKYIFITVLLLLATSAAFAGRRSFYGRIISPSGVGLPMAIIESKDHTYRFQANVNGVFKFKADEDSIDFFIFSAQGFVPKDFLVEDLPEDSIIIELKKKENNLEMVTVGAHGRGVVEATAGDRKGNNTGGCYFTIYDEIALYLPMEKNTLGILQEVGAFIAKGGASDNDFRIHIYAKDSATGAPAEEITDTVVVVKAHHGDQWVRVNLHDKFIQIKGGGVFVSVEWIIGEKNDFLAFDMPKGSPNYYSGTDSLRTSFNGQVLGLTWQDKQPKVYRRYAHNKYEHKDEDKWYLTEPLVGGHRRNGWITPMLYYTYTYIDK